MHLNQSFHLDARAIVLPSRNDQHFHTHNLTHPHGRTDSGLSESDAFRVDTGMGLHLQLSLTITITVIPDVHTAVLRK